MWDDKPCISVDGHMWKVWGIKPTCSWKEIISYSDPRKFQWMMELESIGDKWASSRHVGIRRETYPFGRENVNTTMKIERRKVYKQQFSLTKIKVLQEDIETRISERQINRGPSNSCNKLRLYPVCHKKPIKISEPENDIRSDSGKNQVSVQMRGSRKI